MKKVLFPLFVFVIASVILSACAAPATPTGGGGKVEAIPTAFLGIIESIAGDQWVIDGKTVTVSASVVRDGPFQAGEQVKVEGVVDADGSFRVSRVERPSPQDISTLPRFNDDNSNDSNANDSNSNDANINDDNSNALNSNDDNGNGANLNDDNGNGVNSNDDNGNSANVNDDRGNDSNSNDDHGNGGNANNSGGGNGNGGGDDNSSGGNGNGD